MWTTRESISTGKEKWEMEAILFIQTRNDNGLKQDEWMGGENWSDWFKIYLLVELDLRGKEESRICVDKLGGDQRLEAIVSWSSVKQMFFFWNCWIKDANGDVIDFLKR